MELDALRLLIKNFALFQNKPSKTQIGITSSHCTILSHSSFSFILSLLSLKAFFYSMDIVLHQNLITKVFSFPLV